MYVDNLGYGRRKRHHGDTSQSAVRGLDTVDNFGLSHGLYRHNQNRRYAYMGSFDHNKLLAEHICHMYDKPKQKLCYFIRKILDVLYLCWLNFTNQIDFDISIIQNETFPHSK